MYKISNIVTFYNFLFLMLFIGIISNQIGLGSYVLISCFIVVFTFFKIQINQLNPIVLFSAFFGLSLLYTSFIYQIFQYDYNNTYFIQFFGSQILFLLLFSFFIQIQYFIEKYFSKFLVISLLILVLSVIVDYILLDFGMTSSQLMYTLELESSSYLTKPLGLFGQFSINSTYAVVFYMLYLSFQKEQNIGTNIYLFLLVTLVIILQDSGTGYIAYLLLLATIFYRFSSVRYFLFPLMILAVIYIIKSNMIQKISSEYLYFLYEFLYEIINITYISNIHSVLDILFGIDGNYNFPIDFGPLFMIAKVGLLYFIFYTVVIFYMIFKAPDRYFKMAIFTLVLGNIHYPTLFYPLMNVLLPILLVYLINLKRYYILKDE